MNDCGYYKDGKCYKYTTIHNGKTFGDVYDCEMPVFDCEFCELEKKQQEICKYDFDNGSCGNRYISITEENIAALRNGKILAFTDDEYCTFVILKEGGAEND